MCSTKILARSKNGFISRCEGCQSIHVAFGTAILTFEMEDYTRFCELIEKDMAVLLNKPQIESKCVQIPHPECARVSVVLTRAELYELNNLTQEATILLTCYNILDDAS